MKALDKATKQRLMPLYTETDYYIPDLETSLSIGNQNQTVDDWLTENAAKHAVFITAFNPTSEVLSPSVNQKRNLELVNQIDTLTFLKGRGIPGKTKWVPEESFFVMDLHEDLTLDLMNQFGQFAVVWHQNKKPSQLLWIDRSSGI